MLVLFCSLLGPGLPLGLGVGFVAAGVPMLGATLLILGAYAAYNGLRRS